MNLDEPPRTPVANQPRPAPRRVPTRIEATSFTPVSVPPPESVGVVTPVVIPSPDEVGVKVK
jgi:hypothetical protein